MILSGANSKEGAPQKRHEHRHECACFLGATIHCLGARPEGKINLDYPTESGDFPCLETPEVTYPCSIVEYLGL